MKEITKASEIKKLMHSDEPVAIFYYAAWCPHCKVMHEPWNELEKEEKGKTKFVKMESEDIPSELGISGYPHFVMVKSGKVQAEASGEMSKDQLKQKLLGGSGVGLAFANGGRRRRTRSRRARRTVRKIAH
jgi:thioredoxin-like negative regulator of GroEL